jgi:hypothetical protein
MFLRSKVLPEILSLDAKRDCQRITLLCCRGDFPFDTTRALEFALFRTFSVPSIGGLLDKTREFGDRAQKRYDDTDVIVGAIVDYGYDSERGRRAIERMNALHGRFQIANADFLYVLSTFVFEQIRWLERFGWRPLHEKERLAIFHFWSAVGERMGIRDIPADYEAFERFNVDYERTHFRPNPGSRRVAEATMRLFAGWAPPPFRGLVPPAMRALMDEPLLRALEMPAPPRWVRRLVESALWLRGKLAGLFPRRRPLLRTSRSVRTYPKGYQIEQIGPDDDAAASGCPFSGRGAASRP